MAQAKGGAANTLQKIWTANELKPHLKGTFKISNAPRFEEKSGDVIGLYLHQPERALVLCCDGKCLCQALERTQTRKMPSDLAPHLIIDNYATHKQPPVKKLIHTRINPHERKHGTNRIHLHFMLTLSLRLNLVKRFFRDLSADDIREGSVAPSGE